MNYFIEEICFKKYVIICLVLLQIALILVFVAILMFEKYNRIKLLYISYNSNRSRIIE